MSKRDETKDCPQCFARGCDCECKTCEAARERRKTLTPNQELALSIASALDRQKEQTR